MRPLYLYDINWGGYKSDGQRESQLKVLIDGGYSEIVKDRNENVSGDGNGYEIVKTEEKVDDAILVNGSWSETVEEK